MLKGIQFARVHDWPFLATCGGFQYTLIECARNALGMNDATTAEEDPNAKNIVIYPVACAVPSGPKVHPSSPELSRNSSSSGFLPGWLLRERVVEEEYFCNFEVNPEFEWTAMEAGFPIVARGAGEECRAIESPAHQFFIATLFQPQLSSTAKKPHPLVMAFVQAAENWSRKKLDDSILA